MYIMHANLIDRGIGQRSVADDRIARRKQEAILCVHTFGHRLAEDGVQREDEPVFYDPPPDPSTLPLYIDDSALPT